MVVKEAYTESSSHRESATSVRIGPQVDDGLGLPRGMPDESPVRRLDLGLKRMVDVFVALGIGLVTAPACLLLPLAIKLEDGGPVFFRQVRIGRDGMRFEALKFRSMVPPEDGDRTPQQSAPADELVTTVGTFMREHALDELPQLWNIFKGDMSFVGPRPVPPLERAGDRSQAEVRVSHVPGYEERHRIRPGLTGLAQVYLPRSASHREKFRMDRLYVRRRSLWLDLKLIVQSIWISVWGNWPEVGGRS